jgi:hypothetical protein
MCAYCEDEVDTHKRSFVFSPKSGDCIHLRCFTLNLTYDISHGLKKILLEEDKFRKKKWKKERVKDFTH